MINSDIAFQRLYAQHIASPMLGTPSDVVSWLGAVQAQEYAHSLWAVGLRMHGATEALIEQAIADKSIIRTWFMRGTLHFVAAPDIRWMMTLIAPRMRKLLAGYIGHNSLGLGLDDAVFAKCNDVLREALHGNKQLMRSEIVAILDRAGIVASGLRLSFLLQRAQTDGVICYGARRGRQDTFALLDEWAPLSNSKMMEPSEALAEFTKRYFTSHGPATIQDFVWWSGLTTVDAKAGLEMVKSQLVAGTIEGQTYWSAASTQDAQGRILSPLSPATYLLPNYDEYMVGYRDRSAVFDAQYSTPVNPTGLSSAIVMGGEIIGTWKRTFTKSAVAVEANTFKPLNRDATDALAEAAERYGRFLGLTTTFTTFTSTSTSTKS